MKKILDKRMARLMAKKQKLAERCKASEDANEVRDLTEMLDDVNAEIAETQEQLDALDAQERAAKVEVEERSAVPAEAKLVNPAVLGEFKSPEVRAEDKLSSMEYRQAFMDYALTGEVRSDVISLTETGAAVPMTIINEVINTVRKKYGNLYSKVRKISVKGGVEFPIAALEASFKWINESTVSPRQKTSPVAKISFGYHTAEIRIAQTFLSQLITLSSFEEKIAEIIVRAYLKAMDYAIVNGSGDGSPLGILNDARVTNTVTMKASDISDWTKWRKNFFSTLPLGYRSGEFIFPVATVDAYLETMQDANGNPIFRQATGLEVNDGDATNPNGRFFGREVSLVEPDIIKDFDSASQNDVIGIYWQPEEYVINENFGFTMRRYFDEETNEWVDKALTVVDGKVLNPNGFVKILKG